MSEAHEGDQVAELHGPDHSQFWGTYVRDWISLCDELRDADVRGYLILRSLVYDGKGASANSRVRKLTLAEMCKLIPGPNKKPSSLSRIRELLRNLSAVGLITTPEGGPVTTSSGAKAQGRQLRIKIHDKPANGFTPRWPNTEAKLDSIRPEAERAARAAVERDASRAKAGTPKDEPGQNSDQHDAGRNSDQRGRNSDQAGQNSDPDSRDDLPEREPFSCSCTSAPSTTGDHGADAVGQGAGGFARAGRSDSAADESRQAQGGSAASRNDPLPKQRTTTQSPRPATVKTQPRQEVPGFDVVRAAIPAAVARPGTGLYPGLHRAINDLLTGNQEAGIPRRSPEEVVARLNRRWYGENADQRSAADYRGCDRCTPSGCTAPRRTEERSDGCDRIINRSSWLAVTLLTQDCPDLACEDGKIAGSDEPCKVCRERRAQEEAAARAVAEVAARLQAETEALAAARAEADDWETTRADEERALRTRLAQAGVYGTKLDYQVAKHMAGWRERNPQPGTRPAPRAPEAPPADDDPAPAADVPADDYEAAPTGQRVGPPPSEWRAARAQGWKTVDPAPAPF